MLLLEFEGFNEKRGGISSFRGINPVCSEVFTDFIDYLEGNFGLPDPGRDMSLSSSRKAIQPPHSTSKLQLYQNYCSVLESKGVNGISYFVFDNIWNITRPYIKIFPLRSDMCTTRSRLDNLFRVKMLESVEAQITDTPYYADDVLNDLKKHRVDARNARLFYKNNAEINPRTHIRIEVVNLEESMSILSNLLMHLIIPIKERQIYFYSLSLLVDFLELLTKDDFSFP